MSISLKFNYIPYKVNKMIFDLFTKNITVNKKNGIGFDLCAYSNVYIFIDANYFLNRWFLIWYLILKISEIHFIKSK